MLTPAWDEELTIRADSDPNLDPIDDRPRCGASIADRFETRFRTCQELAVPGTEEGLCPVHGLESIRELAEYDRTCPERYRMDSKEWAIMQWNEHLYLKAQQEAA